MSTRYQFIDDSGETRLAGFLDPDPGGGSIPLLMATVPVSNADLLTADTIPIELLPAPGTGKINFVYFAGWWLNASVGFDLGPALTLWIGNSLHFNLIGLGEMSTASPLVGYETIGGNSDLAAGIIDAAVTLRADAPVANGNGTLTLFVMYAIGDTA